MNDLAVCLGRKLPGVVGLVGQVAVIIVMACCKVVMRCSVILLRFPGMVDLSSCLIAWMWAAVLLSFRRVCAVLQASSMLVWLCWNW